MTMEQLLAGAIGVLIALFITSMYKYFQNLISDYIYVRSPARKAIDKIQPALNTLIEIQPAILQGLKAILEAQKGQCNGNVTEALEIIKQAKEQFDSFLIEQSKG
jgi:predicted PurR-regulated permease PerM